MGYQREKKREEERGGERGQRGEEGWRGRRGEKGGKDMVTEVVVSGSEGEGRARHILNCW